MMPVDWSKLEEYFVRVFEAMGQIERQDVIDLAFANDEPDDVIDAIDALGSRVFRSIDDARAFLVSQSYVQG
jgi:hypothetical protein